ncbi:L,D-transpeptidase Cds6 family protein [Usitatibacter palustris]|uniref:Cds6 C-terminal domain-containing protein n=1 Tax=Usitatibacter palustris TaxID=2732487 RepID=A0A6M4H4X2_9PROT|nr:tetratricopeptide repeat protein [Usitatibacter palustris]QJR14691.1 hypothetical protein DSM104440_01501 [Usitatibacter palustris]
MLQRNSMRKALAKALAGVFFCGAAVAYAAPADDLKDAQKLYTQGRLAPSLEKVDGYLKAQPRDPQGRFLKGLILTEQKKTSEAIQVFTGLTEDYPELPEPYNNLAVLYASQGNYDKAKSALELAIHTHPSYATAHENLGDIYAQLASRAYDRALALDKNNAAAQVKLSMVKDLFSSQKVATAATKPAPTKTAEPKAAEPVKPAPSEPSKQEPPPKVATTTPKTEPTKAEKPKAEPAKAAPTKPAPSAGDETNAQVAAAVTAWAKAWSSKDVAGYLAAYAPDFETPNGEARAAWEKTRTERIEAPKSIEVGVTMKSIKVSGNEATAVFRQAYRSDAMKSNNTKTLKLVKVGDKWLIKQERTGG